MFKKLINRNPPEDSEHPEDDSIINELPSPADNPPANYLFRDGDHYYYLQDDLLHHYHLGTTTTILLSEEVIKYKSLSIISFTDATSNKRLIVRNNSNLYLIVDHSDIPIPIDIDGYLHMVILRSSHTQESTGLLIFLEEGIALTTHSISGNIIQYILSKCSELGTPLTKIIEVMIDNQGRVFKIKRALNCVTSAKLLNPSTKGRMLKNAANKA